MTYSVFGGTLNFAQSQLVYISHAAGEAASVCQSVRPCVTQRKN